MAKKLYEERKIEAIAHKIRDLVPNLYKAQFDTNEMPDGIERVFEEGKRKGRTEGYNSGYGTGYSEGYTRGNKTGYDTGYDKGYSEGSLNSNGGYDDGHHVGYQKGLADGTKAVKEGEARTEDDIIIVGDSFTVPSGYYAETAEKHINIDPFYDAGYADGYEKGKSEGNGVELPTLTNPGTAGDLLAGKELIDSEGNIVVGNIPIKTSNDTIHGDSAITVPSGFYANDVVIDTSSYWDAGYEKGKADCPTYEDGNGVKY